MKSTEIMFEKSGKMTIEPQEFNPVIASNLTTLVDLSDLINDYFAAITEDFVGSRPAFNPATGTIECKLFFKNTPEATQSGVKAVEPIVTSDRSGNTLEKLAKFTKMQAGKTLKFTDEFRDFLRSLYQDPKFDVNKVTSEITDQVGAARYDIYLQISNIPLNKILQHIYGTKDEDNVLYQYDIQLVRPLGQVNPSMVNPGQMYNQPTQVNYLLEIRKLSVSAIDSLSKQLGMLPQGAGSIQMIRKR